MTGDDQGPLLGVKYRRPRAEHAASVALLNRLLGRARKALESHTVPPVQRCSAERYLDSLGVTEEQKQAIGRIGSWGGRGWEDSMQAIADASDTRWHESAAAAHAWPPDFPPAPHQPLGDRYGLARLGLGRAVR